MVCRFVFILIIFIYFAVSVSWWLLLIACALIFIVLFAIIILAAICLGRSLSSQHRGSLSRYCNERMLSVATCFAAGVFLAACFTGLMPHAQSLERFVSFAVERNFQFLSCLGAIMRSLQQMYRHMNTIMNTIMNMIMVTICITKAVSRRFRF
jgi:zinc transporter ZupT